MLIIAIFFNLWILLTFIKGCTSWINRRTTEKTLTIKGDKFRHWIAYMYTWGETTEPIWFYKSKHALPLTSNYYCQQLLSLGPRSLTVLQSPVSLGLISSVTVFTFFSFAADLLSSVTVALSSSAPNVTNLHTGRTISPRFAILGNEVHLFPVRGVVGIVVYRAK